MIRPNTSPFTFSRNFLRTFATFLVIVGCVYLIRWPVFRVDTDLWYYMSNGRYIIRHLSIPRDTYFSFISPPRHWVNYSWLFSVLLYVVYRWTQYVGLIVLRAALYLATLWIVRRYLLQVGREERDAFWSMGVLVLYTMVFIPHYLSLRPHMFTYVFLAAFLYLLEFGRRKIFLLPVLTVLWCNLQGVDYPIILAVNAAYAIEYAIERFKLRGRRRYAEIPFIAAIALSIGAIYLTPNGSQLIEVPFRFLHYHNSSPFVTELRPFPLATALSINVVNLIPSYVTLVRVLLLTICLASIVCFSRGNLRVSHTLLLGVAAILMGKGVRLVYTSFLLALPVVSRGRLIDIQQFQRFVGLFAKPVRILFVLVGFFIPVLFVRSLSEQLGIPGRYPFSSRDLPVGVATFLNALGTGGSVLNFPDSGGYLRWRLEPQYQIFVDDVEYPYLFGDSDCYLAEQAFFRAEVLTKILATYHPAFISVPMQFKQFEMLISQFPEYVPVFFDDAEVLYVDRQRHGEVAARYALTQFNPLQIEVSNVQPSNGSTIPLERLLQLYSIYPEGRVINHLIAAAKMEQGAYEDGLPYAARVRQNFPKSPEGFWLTGDLLFRLNRLDQALTFYQATLERLRSSDVVKRGQQYQTMGRVCLRQGKYEQAYRMLQKSVNVFASDTSITDLYFLGTATVLSKHTEDAERILTFLSYETPFPESIRSNVTSPPKTGPVRPTHTTP